MSSDGGELALATLPGFADHKRGAKGRGLTIGVGLRTVTQSCTLRCDRGSVAWGPRHGLPFKATMKLVTSYAYYAFYAAPAAKVLSVGRCLDRAVPGEVKQ